MARIDITNSGVVKTEDEERSVSFTMELVDNPKVAGMRVEIKEAYIEYDESGEIDVIGWGEGLFFEDTDKRIEDTNNTLYKSIVEKYGDSIDDEIIKQYKQKYEQE